MTDRILILNDDCFLQIFKYFSLIDLANFKETYPTRCTVADTGFCMKTKRTLDFDVNANEKDSIRIIKHFGSLVSHLVINYGTLGISKWSEVFLMIGEHCNEKLKSLSLIGEAVRLLKVDDVRPIANVLKNIEELTIETYDYGSVSLSYGDDYGSNEFFAVSSYFENVRSITLKIDIDLPATIFQKNGNLVTLKIRGWIKDSNLKQIVDNLLNTRLENLFLVVMKRDYADGNLSELRRLNYLKRLSIECDNDMDINPFLLNVNAFDALNILSIGSAQLDDTSIATLGRIVRLTVLQLTICTLNTSSHFQSLLVLCGNKNLEHLRFLCDLMDFVGIAKVNFRKIVEARKASAAGKCLHLTFRHLIYTASIRAIPSELLEENKETIQLIHERDRSYEYYDLK